MNISKTQSYISGFRDGVAEADRPTVELVREFHEAFGREIPSAPTVSTEDVREMRVKLIAEELMELCQALRVDLTLRVECIHPDETLNLGGDFLEMYVFPNAANYGEPDLFAAADGLGDLEYVVAGGFLDFGLPATEIVSEIHRSNMSKLDENGKPILRADGKILKGALYSPPDLAPIIEAAGRSSD